MVKYEGTYINVGRFGAIEVVLLAEVLQQRLQLIGLVDASDRFLHKRHHPAKQTTSHHSLSVAVKLAN